MEPKPGVTYQPVGRASPRAGQLLQLRLGIQNHQSCVVPSSRAESCIASASNSTPVVPGRAKSCLVVVAGKARLHDPPLAHFGS